jgi:hypothetical protein
VAPFANITIRIEAPDGAPWDSNEHINAATEAIDDLKLNDAVRRLIVTHLESRAIFDGYTVEVSDND